MVALQAVAPGVPVAARVGARRRSEGCAGVAVAHPCVGQNQRTDCLHCENGRQPELAACKALVLAQDQAFCIVGLPPSELIIYEMILTQCAVCATELGLSLGKKCGRCSTRYCGADCQKQHWESGGYDKLCKLIKKAGGAEQYNANKKYAEAVAAAVEKCAEDTKGQTCFICTQALHWKTKEGLVRGCSCCGTAGFAHVSCLAEQAKILFAEAEENNLGIKVRRARWVRWHTCGLCEQRYHGVVHCALGWACWKTYVGRPEANWARRLAIGVLGNGLHDAKHHEDASAVFKARLSALRRTGAPEKNVLVAAGNLANSYHALGRCEEALRLRQEVYSGHLKLNGEEDHDTLREANNYASILKKLNRFEEAKALFRKTIPVARRVLGESHHLTLNMMMNYGGALYDDDSATIDDYREAVSTLEDTERIARRVLGGAHPVVQVTERSLGNARLELRASEGDVEALRSIPPRRRGGAGPREGDVDALREAVAAL